MLLLRFASIYAYDKSLFNKLVVGSKGATQLASYRTALHENSCYKNWCCQAMADFWAKNQSSEWFQAHPYLAVLRLNKSLLIFLSLPFFIYILHLHALRTSTWRPQFLWCCMAMMPSVIAEDLFWF